MNYGELLALDQTGDLIASMAERIVHLTMKDPIEENSLKRAIDGKHILDASSQGTYVRAVINGEMSIHAAIDSLGLSLQGVSDIRTEEGDLEHAFLKILRESRKTNVQI